MAFSSGGKLIIEEDKGEKERGVKGRGGGVCRLLCTLEPPDVYRA